MIFANSSLQTLDLFCISVAFLRPSHHPTHQFGDQRPPNYKTKIFHTFRHNYLQMSIIFRNFAGECRFD